MTLDTTLILMKSVIATFINRTLTNPLTTLDHAVDEAMEVGISKKTIMGDAGEGEIIESLTDALRWIRETPKTVEVDQQSLLTTIKAGVGFDSDYIAGILDSLKDEITLQDDEKKLVKIKHITSELSYYTKKKKIKKLAMSFYRDVDMCTGNESVDLASRQFSSLLESETQVKDDKPIGYVGELDTTNIDGVEEVLKETKKANSSEGSIYIPLQGITDGLGGISYRPGDMICYFARSNQYKSGMLLDHTKWIPMFNDAQKLMSEKGKKEGKKPLILRISFENTPAQDALTLYKSIFEYKEQKEIDISKIDPKEAAKKLVKELKGTGYEVAIVCFDPNKFDVWKLIDVISKYQSDGYEIHALICDYLEIIAKANKAVRQDTAIAEAFEVARNHCMPHRITFITAHQLNTASGDLLGEIGSAAFTKKVAEAGGVYAHNCRSLIQKLDVEIILHIHKQGDDKYLSFSIGKLRERLAPESKKHFYYKFQKYGGIVPDHGGPSQAIYSLSSVQSGSEENSVEW